MSAPIGMIFCSSSGGYSCFRVSGFGCQVPGLSKVNLHHGIDLRASCGANSAMLQSKFRANETLELCRVVQRSCQRHDFRLLFRRVQLVYGLWFVVSVFGFRVSIFGFRVPGFVSSVSGVGFRVSCLRFRGPVLGLRVTGSGVRLGGAVAVTWTVSRSMRCIDTRRRRQRSESVGVNAGQKPGSILVCVWGRIV